MAPLTKAFIGAHVLNPYFQRYESAVNLAAAKFSSAAATPLSTTTATTKDRIYRLATTRNVGMTGIMLFARDWSALQDIRTTELGFGAGDMANKGAVGLRFSYTKEVEEGDAEEESRKTTELTFVSTHLQAMEWNLETRNKNWATIASRLVFDDPKKYINSSSTNRPTIQPTPRGAGNNDEDRGEEEAQNLLNDDDDDDDDDSEAARQKALHDISIFKPGAHLFVSGDLNYRISKTSPGSGAVFPSLDPASPDHYARFLALDQLTAEREAGHTLHGLSEAEIRFPPTYKLKIASTTPVKKADTAPRGEEQQGDGDEDMDEVEELLEDEEVDWRWAIHRWPGWCDRVLYLEIPWWTKETLAASSSSNPLPSMTTIAYDALPAVRSSDHRAVYLRIAVPVLDSAELAPSPAAIEAELARGDVDGSKRIIDPRVKLPFPIDAQSWDHRAFVKQWEQALGWSMLVSQSRPAIALFATMLVVGLGAWWFGRVGLV